MLYVLECLTVNITCSAYRSPIGLYDSLDAAMAAVKTYGVEWHYGELRIGKYHYPRWIVEPFGKATENHAWYRITETTEE